MVKNIIYKIALCALLFVSCDSLLDINIKQSLSDNLLDKPSDADGLATAAYARIANLGPVETVFMSWWSGSMRADDTYKGGGGLVDGINGYGAMETFSRVSPASGLVLIRLFSGVIQLFSTLQNLQRKNSLLKIVGWVRCCFFALLPCIV